MGVSGVQTRSQHLASNQQQLVEVKLPVKIVRLLASDLVHHLLDDQEEEEEEDGVGGDNMEASLSKLLAGSGGVARGGDWEVEEDQDMLDEPAYQLNLLVSGQGASRCGNIYCVFVCVFV